MKNTAKEAKEPKTKRPTARGAAAPKVRKAEPKGKSADRLPGSLQELKASKGGLVSFLFLSGEDNEAIAKELKAAFKLTDLQGR